MSQGQPRQAPAVVPATTAASDGTRARVPFNLLTTEFTPPPQYQDPRPAPPRISRTSFNPQAPNFTPAREPVDGLSTAGRVGRDEDGDRGSCGSQGEYGSEQGGYGEYSRLPSICGTSRINNPSAGHDALTGYGAPSGYGASTGYFGFPSLYTGSGYGASTGSGPSWECGTSAIDGGSTWYGASTGYGGYPSFHPSSGYGLAMSTSNTIADDLFRETGTGDGWQVPQLPQNIQPGRSDNLGGNERSQLSQGERDRSVMPNGQGQTAAEPHGRPARRMAYAAAPAWASDVRYVQGTVRNGGQEAQNGDRARGRW